MKHMPLTIDFNIYWVLLSVKKKIFFRMTGKKETPCTAQCLADAVAKEFNKLH